MHESLIISMKLYSVRQRIKKAVTNKAVKKAVTNKAVKKAVTNKAVKKAVKADHMNPFLTDAFIMVQPSFPARKSHHVIF